MHFVIKKGSGLATHDYLIQYEDKKTAYTIIGKPAAPSGKLQLLDPTGRRFFIIKKILEHAAEAFAIIDSEDDVIARIAIPKTRKLEQMKIDSDYGVFILKGDLSGGNYAILQENEEIARLEKKHPSSSDTYVLDIYDYDTEELLAMAAGAESLEFENTDEEDFFDAFLIAMVVALALLFNGN